MRPRITGGTKLWMWHGAALGLPTGRDDGLAWARTPRPGMAAGRRNGHPKHMAYRFDFRTGSGAGRLGRGGTGDWGFQWGGSVEGSKGAHLWLSVAPQDAEGVNPRCFV